MNDKNKVDDILRTDREERIKGENLDVEWGENHEERILDDTPRNKSIPHDCKGRHCDTAFDKL